MSRSGILKKVYGCEGNKTTLLLSDRGRIQIITLSNSMSRLYYLSPPSNLLYSDLAGTD